MTVTGLRVTCLMWSEQVDVTLSLPEPTLFENSLIGFLPHKNDMYNSLCRAFPILFLIYI